MRSVTEYGASGDGADDDRSAIQAAVDDAAETGGDRVSLPAGEYRICGPITHRSGVHLVGDGTGATAIRADGEGFSALEGFGEPGDPLTDLSVRDLTVNASGVPGDEEYDPGEKCIYYQHVRRCRIEGVYAYGSAATGIGTDMMVDSLVADSIAEDCGRNFEAGRDGLNIGSNGIGIGTGLAADTEPVAVVNCHARANGNNGIMFENQSTGEGPSEHHAGHFFAAGCTAIGNRVGFRTSADRRVRVTNCSAHENREEGIVIDGKGEMNPKELHPPFSAREHRIDGCHVTVNGGDGVFVTDEGTGTLDVSTSQIIDNGGAGLRVETGEPVENVAVADCRLAENGGPGIDFANGGSGLRVADCDVADNGHGERAGIRFGDRAERVTVSGCHVTAEHEPGIAFEASHDAVSVVGNQFHGRTPLEIPGSPEVVESNVGLSNESVGTAAAVGDGERTEFVLPHGLDATPAVRNVWAESTAATGFYVEGADEGAIVVAFENPPSAGEQLQWGFEVRY